MFKKMNLVPNKKITIISPLTSSALKEKLAEVIHPKAKKCCEELDMKEPFEGEIKGDSFHIIMNQGKVWWHLYGDISEKNGSSIISCSIKPHSTANVILITITLCLLIPYMLLVGLNIYRFINDHILGDLPAIKAFAPLFIAIFPYLILRANLERSANYTKEFFSEPIGFSPGFMA